MRVVIEIPKDMWEKIQEGYVPLGISKYLKRGTVLPPNHGDLIDKNDIGLSNFEIFMCVMCSESYKEALTMLCEKLENAPTILEGTVKK